jgi:hypothetical protein
MIGNVFQWYRNCSATCNIMFNVLTIWNIKFSQQQVWRLEPSTILRCVVSLCQPG